MLYKLRARVFLLLGFIFSRLVFFNFESAVVSFDFNSLISSEFIEGVFYLDWMGGCFIAVLFFIVRRVLFFSSSYMVGEVKKIRFFSLIFLFVSSMVVLILVPNLLFFFIGWDGLGFTSFLLVAWFGCFFSRSARVKTFLVKRFGDSLLFLGLVNFFFQGHFNLFTYFDRGLWFATCLILFATFTKRAQFPFRSWLPAAMAAPTPVSSLVHSSTLVTAGIYFLIRFKNLFSYGFCFIISGVGLFTMFFSSICAIMDMDLKKIVAFSTLRQLGFMCFTVGVNFTGLCFFYLLVHACFKALMFISVGVLMVFRGHNQDIRSLRNLWFFNPLIFLNLFVSVVSLRGVPFLSGFIFKDLIIYTLGSRVFNFFFIGVFVVSIILTSFYSFRLVFLSIFRDFRHAFFSQSYSVLVFRVAPLYLCRLLLGFIFKNFFVLYFNIKRVFIFSILLFIFFGAFLGVKSFIFSFTGLIHFYRRVVFVFFCYYLNVRLNSFFCTGSNLFFLFDKGLFSFGFIENLGSMFSYGYNLVYSLFFSVGWLRLVLFSYFLLGAIWIY